MTDKKSYFSAQQRLSRYRAAEPVPINNIATESSDSDQVHHDRTPEGSVVEYYSGKLRYV